MFSQFSRINRCYNMIKVTANREFYLFIFLIFSERKEFRRKVAANCICRSIVIGFGKSSAHLPENSKEKGAK